MKHVIYWCAQAWKKVNSSTLEKWWNKLFDGLVLSDDAEEEENLHILLENIPGCENIEESEISDWINSDVSELDFTEQDIVDMDLQKRREQEK
ncbi:hypothetical protein PR048_020821 [Dryococelus australis]|uniref:DDE-1 domain-containing protein n=1 Tax=Dryococelus australis TaxID=614101 RepID=A0ABQ9GWH8_9NEOP|nr:hypothetical protein PR048_020821 [Dryococelus australis]